MSTTTLPDALTIRLSGIVKRNPTFSLARKSAVTGEWTVIKWEATLWEAAELIRSLSVTDEAQTQAILALTKTDIGWLTLTTREEDGDGGLYEIARH